KSKDGSFHSKDIYFVSLSLLEFPEQLSTFKRIGVFWYCRRALSRLIRSIPHTSPFSLRLKTKKRNVDNCRENSDILGPTINYQGPRPRFPRFGKRRARQPAGRQEACCGRRR